MERRGIVIIGAGVSGCACARELSRYEADILVLERADDVGAGGASKANSAIVHAGYDAPHGSLMARLNVEGSRLMEPLSRELDFLYRRNGSLVVCLEAGQLPRLRALYENGLSNGVEGLALLDGGEARRREPRLAPGVQGALWAPTGAIVCPFQLTLAFAENAAANGVEFRFDTAVERVERADGGYLLHTSGGTVWARCVVNAAGVYADALHNMVSARKLHITPRRGEYLLLDADTAGFVGSTIFQLPGRLGKGVLVAPTVHGNTIVGPTAQDIPDKEDTDTTAAGLALVAQSAAQMLPDVPLRQVITSFAGLRAHEDGHEFCIGEPEDAPGFVDVAGIESPGLSASPAVGRMVAALVRGRLGLASKRGFCPRRQGLVQTRRLDAAAHNALIRQDPAYGRVVCRCRQVTEGEIVAAIRRPLGARSVDGVKRRTEAGMGRCQAGFCTPKVLEILSRELGVAPEQVTKRGGASRLLAQPGPGGQVQGGEADGTV